MKTLWYLQISQPPRIQPPLPKAVNVSLEVGKARRIDTTFPLATKVAQIVLEFSQPSWIHSPPLPTESVDAVLEGGESPWVNSPSLLAEAVNVCLEFCQPAGVNSSSFTAKAVQILLEFC